MVHGNSRAISSSRWRGCWWTVRFLQLITHRPELLPPCRGARARQLTAHGRHMAGGREDVWLVLGGGGGMEAALKLHFGSSKLKTVQFCVPPTPPSFQKERMKTEDISAASVIVSLASSLECCCREPRCSSFSWWRMNNIKESGQISLSFLFFLATRHVGS